VTAVNTASPLACEIRRDITRALCDYNMLNEGDRVLVAVSGGKDSVILAFMLREIQRRAPFSFTITPVLIDQGQPDFDTAEFERFMHENGLPLTIVREKTYTLVREKIPEGDALCPLCARLRRGILYTYADKNGFSKIALGHHRDDLIETLLMNIFYEGRIASMPPKLRSDDSRNIVIRPMAYAAESDLIALAHEWRIPVVSCGSCASGQGPMREGMRELVDRLEKESPGVRSSLLSALSNIRLSQMLDRRLWDFDDFQTQCGMDG